jgi:hypothetical protein
MDDFFDYEFEVVENDGNEHRIKCESGVARRKEKGVSFDRGVMNNPVIFQDPTKLVVDGVRLLWRAYGRVLPLLLLPAGALFSLYNATRWSLVFAIVAVERRSATRGFELSRRLVDGSFQPLARAYLVAALVVIGGQAGIDYGLLYLLEQTGGVSAIGISLVDNFIFSLTLDPLIAAVFFQAYKTLQAARFPAEGDS